jgi:predicted nucleic acid-binding protein
MSLVLDSSAAPGWIYVDKAGAAARRIFALVEASGAWVPAIWRLEVGNSLQIGVRRGRIDAAFRDAAIHDLSLLDLSVDPDTDAQAWSSTLRLAERFGLTTYDAAYLELAQRRALPLGSLDQPLCLAAGTLGVALIE